MCVCVNKKCFLASMYKAAFSGMFQFFSNLYAYAIVLGRCYSVSLATRLVYENIYAIHGITCIEGKSFYIITRLPVTRWVKLSLNFEFLVPK